MVKYWKADGALFSPTPHYPHYCMPGAHNPVHAPFLHFARIFADRLSSMSKAQIIPVSLFGSPLLSPEQNNDLFFHVQSFISEPVRFYKST